MNNFAIVLGEPNSINSEILAKSKAYKTGAVIIGSYKLLNSQLKILKIKRKLKKIRTPEEIDKKDKVLNVLDIPLKFKEAFKVNNKESSNYVRKCLVISHNLCLKKKIKGIINCSVNKKNLFKNKNILIAGGGDSALDWTIELSNIASSLTLIHRRNEFRGALDSVEKVQELKNKNKIKLITPSEVVSLIGDKKLEAVEIKVGDSENLILDVDHFIPLFGLTPKLGPINDWGLEIEKNSIKVDNSLDYQTNIPGIFAIGDINTYPGKLKLILCGFHEAAMMCQSAYKIINPDKKFVLKYTTVSGVSGFDGTVKKADLPVRKSID